MTRSSQRQPGVRFAARAILSSLVMLAGVTCRDLPTEPDASGSGAMFLLTGLTITPSLDTLLIGQNLTMTVTNSNGSPINKQAAWTSSDTTVVKMTVTGLATARATARKAGTVTITATSQNKGGTATVVVIPVPVRSVSVTPDSASVERGDSVQFTATPMDSAGNALTGRVVVWSTADTLVARATAAGLARTLTRGTTQVLATVEGVVGTASLKSRLAQLTIPAISSIDTANAGDTLVIAYTAQNLWDSPNADSVLVRIGLRAPDGTVYAAQRRAFARINGGASVLDTVRLALPITAAAGTHSVVAYVDCAESAGATEVARLGACIATPAAAGTIREGDETDNSHAANVVVRGPDISAGALVTPDSLFTRTTVSVSVPLANSGSSTGAGFGISAGLFDVTSGSYVAAATTTTASLGSRQSRAVDVPLVLPASLDPTHTYEVRAFADCRASGASDIERIQACFVAPASAGEIGESNETNNTASRSVAVASNVARLDAQPDSVTLTALGDESSLTGTAYDRANATVAGVTILWISLDPAIVTVTATGTVHAAAPGSARVVGTSEGRADTVRVQVVQQVAHVISTPASVSLGSLGETAQLSASVLDRNENPIAGATVAWSSLDPTVASVSATGLVTATALGSARIVATSSGIADTTNVSVAQLPARVVASPDAATAASIGDSTQLTAIVYDANGNVITAASIAWSTPDSAIARVTPTGLAFAQMNGTARIIASSGGHADTTLFQVQQVVASVVATPDSAVITTLGGTAAFSAGARDARGNAITGAPITWSSLDPSIAGVTNGVATAVGAGRAHVVASSDSRADTVIVVVDPRPTTVVIAPDTASVAAGAGVTLSAVARDGSGAVLTGVTFTWTSLDPSVASVGDGSVTGIAVGTARIVASTDGVADTAIVLVNPAGYALRWIGGRSSSWYDAANWYPHSVPDSTRATYIPAGTPNQAALTPNVAASTGNFLLAPGATVDGANAVLDVYGNIDSYGTVGFANFNLLASGTVRGSLPGLLIGSANGPLVTATLAGRTTVTESVSMQAYPSMHGRLVLNGNTLVTPVLNVGAGSEVIQTNPADSLIVNLSLSAMADGQGARSQLTAGVIVIGNEYRVSGSGDAFSPGGTHKVVAAGPGTKALRISDTTSAAFQDLDIENGVTQWDGQPGIVAGRLHVKPGASLVSSAPNSGEIQFRSALPEFDNATYDIATTKVIGDVTLTRNHRFTQNLSVDNNGRLTLGGHTLLVPAITIYRGTLTMSNGADTLITTLGGSYYGIANLSAGTLITNGALEVHPYPDAMPGAAWNVSGSHKVVFDGTQPQMFTAYDTTYAHFQNVEIRNAAGVSFSNVVNVAGLLKMMPGSRANGAGYSNATIKVFSQLPDVSAGSYDVPTTMVAGSISAQRNESFTQNLFIDGGGSLRLAGHRISVAAVNVYRGTLVMDNAADTLITTLGGSYYGLANLSAGTLITNGALEVHPYPDASPGAAWNVSGTHKVIFAGTQPQMFTAYDTTYMHFQNVEIQNGAGVTLSGTVNVAGLLKVMPGAVAQPDPNYYGNSRVKVFTQLPDVGSGTYNVTQTSVAGPLVATRNEAFSQGLFIENGGSLRLAGHTISVANMNVYQGTLVMNTATDSLIVTSGAAFYGLENLSAGTLVARGILYVNPLAGPVPGAAWNVSGTHTVVFDGTQPQQFSPYDTTYMHFQNVEIRNPAGVLFGGSVVNVAGLLKLMPGARAAAEYSGSGRIKVFTQLPDVSAGSYEVGSTTVGGNIVATRNETFANGLSIEDGGSLTLGGKKIETGFMGVYSGTLTMNNAADTLVVNNGVSFYGREQLSAGTMVLRNGYTTIGVGIPSLSSWNASGTHKTVFAGVTPQQLAIYDTTLAKLNDVEITNTQGVTIPGLTTVNGLMKLVGGGRVSTDYNELRFSSQLPDISGGVYDVAQTGIVGNVTASRNVVFPSQASILVETGGNLALGGHTVRMPRLGTHGGTLTMDNAADTLVIDAYAELYGPANLSAGNLIVRGDMNVGQLPGMPTTLNGGPGHTTIFAGTAAQTLTMPQDTMSHFGGLRIDNASGVQIAADLFIRGKLMGIGGGVLRGMSSSGYVAHVSGGLNVLGLTMDGVLLDVNGGDLARFDNVTFQNVYGPSLFRIRHAGTGSAFTMNNLSFLVQPAEGLYWIDATDSGGGNGAFTLDIVSPQAADGPASTRTTNGAVVGWRLPQGGGGPRP